MRGEAGYELEMSEEPEYLPIRPQDIIWGTTTIRKELADALAPSLAQSALQQLNASNDFAKLISPYHRKTFRERWLSWPWQPWRLMTLDEEALRRNAGKTITIKRPPPFTMSAPK